LLEGTVYGKDGQLLTASYMDYCMPRADNLPSFQCRNDQDRCPSNPLGIKGCGEAGAIAAPPAVINALTDAIAARMCRCRRRRRPYGWRAAANKLRTAASSEKWTQGGDPTCVSLFE